MSLHNLSKEELIELLQLAVKEYPDFKKKVDETVQISALKPPPKENYDRLLSDFDEHLTMLDGLRPSQQFGQVWRITEKIYPIIEKVKNSVNQNSPLEDIEKAFNCLYNFATSMMDTEGEIQKSLVGYGGGSMDDVKDGMVEVGELMKKKGGPTDSSLKAKIQNLINEFELEFEDVVGTIWGYDESDEYGTYDDEEAEPSIPAKRARLD